MKSETRKKSLIIDHVHQSSTSQWGFFATPPLLLIANGKAEDCLQVDGFERQNARWCRIIVVDLDLVSYIAVDLSLVVNNGFVRVSAKCVVFVSYLQSVSYLCGRDGQ